MMRKVFTISACASLAISCGSPKDDDPTPVIMSAYNEGTFSIRMFELKVDSTFRYERHLAGTNYDTRGSWKVVNDTFVLYARNDVTHTYGRIAIKDTLPQFIWDPSDSALFDMSNTNCRLIHHDPPENVNFGVVRR